MKTVIFYEIASNALPKAAILSSAHRAWVRQFAARDLLLMNGSASDGAVGVFESREDAECFIKGDPFVAFGIVAKWSLREWEKH